MKLLHSLITVICLFSYISLNTVCSECNIKNVNVFSYNDPKSIKQLANQTYVNLTKLKGGPRIVIVTRQNVPYLCKKITKKFRKTEMLFLANNRIKEIEGNCFSDMKKLKSLDLSKNQLTSIHAELFNKLRNLIYLDLSQNQITTIDQISFDNMRNLKEFNISDNKLTTISNRWFANCPKLYKLEFRKNKITQLHYLAFLHLNTELNITIDLSMNKISKISNGAFENILYIDKLELQNNNLTDLPPFNELRRGRILNLKGNKIKCLNNDTLQTFTSFEKVRMKRDAIDPNCLLNDETTRASLHISFAN